MGFINPEWNRFNSGIRLIEFKYQAFGNQYGNVQELTSEYGMGNNPQHERLLPMTVVWCVTPFNYANHSNALL